MSAEGQRWLSRRVQVFAAYDHHKQHGPIAEGVVVGYAQHPTICVRSDDGRQSDWQVTLPITVLEENAAIPPSSNDWEILAAARVAVEVLEVDYASRMPADIQRLIAAVRERGQ